MGQFCHITQYVGDDPLAEANPPATALNLPDGSMTLWFRTQLLKTPQTFSVPLRLRGLRAVDLQWAVARHTGGLALWFREKRCQAASVYLSGVDLKMEVHELAGALASGGLSVRPDLWAAVQQQKPPILATTCYTLDAWLDPVIATGASALAAAFFSTLGQTGE